MTQCLFLKGDFHNAENIQNHTFQTPEEKGPSANICLERLSVCEKTPDQSVEEVDQVLCPHLDRKRKHSGEKMQNDGSLKENYIEELEDEFASKAKKRKNSKGNQVHFGIPSACFVK